MQRSHEIEEVLETLWIRSQEKNEQSIDCMALNLKDASILGEMQEQALVTVQNGSWVLPQKGSRQAGTLSAATGWQSFC